MTILSIQASEDVDTIKRRLTRQVESLAENGVDISWIESAAADYTVLHFLISENNTTLADNSLDMCKYHIASALSDYILNELERKIIANLLAGHHLPEKECAEIEEKVVAQLSTTDYNQRKTHLLYRFLDYFDTHTFLNLKGFVQFRLKDFHQKIASVITHILTEKQAQEEHREFVSLLRSFVALSKPRTSLAQVIV